MNLSDIIAEISFGDFKKNIKHRTKQEQLHKAIKDVKIRLKEINRIIQHTAKLKNELCENDEELTYWKNTEPNIQELKHMMQEIYLKIHSLKKQ